jgi:hypothetical protein
MILPTISGDKNLVGNFFFFGCDLLYFNEYGKVLVNSLKFHAPWANIHCHIFNPTEDQIIWCKNKKISVSYEFVDPNIDEIKTYYACVRFIRIPEIFKDESRIISLDCDSIAISNLSEEKFIQDTNTTKVFWRSKGNHSLASTVLFGNDSVRHTYATKLKKYFEEDNYKWFLDQDVMDQMISNGEFGTTEDVYWGTTSLKKKKGAIWTGKGDKKFVSEFQKLLKMYRE